MIFLPKLDAELIVKLMRAHRDDGRADVLHAAAAEPGADEGSDKAMRLFIRARRLCWPKPIANGPRAPARRCSSATA